MIAAQFWAARLVALNRKIAAVEAGELTLPKHGQRRALYDARAGVADILHELQAREVMSKAH